MQMFILIYSLCFVKHASFQDFLTVWFCNNGEIVKLRNVFSKQDTRCCLSSSIDA
jgi:hypothetical protein